MSKLKPYPRLRAALTEHGIEQLYLAKLMHRSVRYVNERLTGKAAWRQDEMYFLMDTLHISHDQMHLYFPPNGREDALRITSPQASASQQFAQALVGSLQQMLDQPKGNAKRAPIVPITAKRAHGGRT